MPVEFDGRIRLGGFFAFAGGCAGFMQMILSVLLGDASNKLASNPVAENAVAWGNLAIMFGALSVFSGLCYLMLSLGLYASGRKLNLGIARISGYVGSVAGIGEGITGAYVAYIGLSMRGLAIEQALNALVFLGVVSMIVGIVDLIWLMTAGYAFVRIGSLTRITLGTIAGISLIVPMVLSLIYAPASSLLSGIALILVGITLIRLASFKGSAASGAPSYFHPYVPSPPTLTEVFPTPATVRCTNCGESVPPGVAFCQKCGQKVG